MSFVELNLRQKVLLKRLFMCGLLMKYASRVSYDNCISCAVIPIENLEKYMFILSTVLKTRVSRSHEKIASVQGLGGGDFFAC